MAALLRDDGLGVVTAAPIFAGPGPGGDWDKAEGPGDDEEDGRDDDGRVDDDPDDDVTDDGDDGLLEPTGPGGDWD